MAYALALQASTQLEVGPVILVCTLVYSLITILGFSTVLHPILSSLDVKNKPKAPGEIVNTTENCSNRLKRNLSHFDTYYFAPLFIKDNRMIESNVRTESLSINDFVINNQTELSNGYIG